MTCFELRRKWWHRLIIGWALVLGTLSAGAVAVVTHDNAQSFWNIFGGPIPGPIIVFTTVFFAIFVLYRILIRIVAGNISK